MGDWTAVAATTYRAEARRRWGSQADWINGDGRYATLARCPSGGSGGHDRLTVQLHVTPEQANEALAFIAQFGCGGACRGRHELVDLEPSAV